MDIDKKMYVRVLKILGFTNLRLLKYKAINIKEDGIKTHIRKMLPSNNYIRNGIISIIQIDII